MEHKHPFSINKNESKNHPLTTFPLPDALLCKSQMSCFTQETVVAEEETTTEPL